MKKDGKKIWRMSAIEYLSTVLKKYKSKNKVSRKLKMKCDLWNPGNNGN